MKGLHYVVDTLEISQLKAVVLLAVFDTPEKPNNVVRVIAIEENKITLENMAVLYYALGNTFLHLSDMYDDFKNEVEGEWEE